LSDQHFGFVVAAYVLGAVIVAAMIIAIFLDYSALKRALSRFPGRGERDEAPNSGRPLK
jgi:heme exporter protein CcmD